jgi:F-type H+-transporting ATPase subunit gamma
MMNAKEIKARIKSVQDTRKITNAMYMIASTKMRKARNDLDKTRPYFKALYEEMEHIFKSVEDIESRYVCTSAGNGDNGKTYGVLVITADKGLAGSYNKNVIKEAMELISKYKINKLFVVGEYGRRFFMQRDINIEKSFLYTAQNPTMDRAREIAALLLDMYDKGELDEIYIIYSDMKNSLATKVIQRRLLPFQRTHFYSIEDEKVQIFEVFPSVSVVVDSLVKSWLSGFIYSALVESFCSEQSSRMAAMYSANKNAEKIMETLTIQYNLVRQANITQEITEVTASAKAQIRKRKKEVL